MLDLVIWSLLFIIAVSKKSSGTKLQIEKNYSVEEIEEMAIQMLPADILSGLVDSNWKTRLAAVEQLLEVIETFICNLFLIISKVLILY